MEHLHSGDLQHYVDQHGGMAEPDLQAVIRQVLKGLDFMHRENFTHRDIKPGNILIKTQSPKWWVKISDFGISKRLASSMVLLSKSKGAIACMAPELPISGAEKDDKTLPFPSQESLSRYLSREDAFPGQKLVDKGASVEAAYFNCSHHNFIPDFSLADYASNYTVVKRIAQMYIDVRRMDMQEKFKVIRDLYSIHTVGQLVIFAQSTDTAYKLYSDMRYDWGISAELITQTREKNKRPRRLTDLNAGRIKVLVSSMEIDGTGIESVTMVVNYNLPTATIKGGAHAYLRRVGVAGGFNGRGICINLAHGMDFFDALEEFTRIFHKSTVQLGLTDLNLAQEMIDAEILDSERHRRGGEA
ncbi:hypothetical protein NM208_g5209 [Fusarium decemcellulare]|uniref:Uncharacterized protein n=2 Tax=Fusarium decemcellulare TaxID=57161 RepID=A0ACC1SI17_9HYPO|nr:hypothetical protein NM208_g5472 [Fusarium decemcellulare]KAJ3540089.1 hypothetical protein NM208_g5209 [Fusarium decemcellulare]